MSEALVEAVETNCNCQQYFYERNNATEAFLRRIVLSY